MLNPAKDDAWYDPAKVKEFMGVEPAQVADLLALKGDAIDNIPGAPGIGEKGAQTLIDRFGSVEAASSTPPNRAQDVPREPAEQRERIRMSKRLATISTDVPIEFDLEAVQRAGARRGGLKAVYKELEFYSLLKELGPAEDTRARDYRRHRHAEELAGLARKSSRRVRLPSGGSGDLQIRRRRIRARHDRPCLALRRSARRHRRTAAAAQAVAGRRRRPQNRLRREIRAAGARPPGHRSPRLRARRDALRLPAGCRPLRLPARRAGAPPARSRTSAPRPSSTPISRSKSASSLRPRSRRAACASSTRHRAAAGARAGAHGAHRHPHRPRRAEAALGADGDARSRGSPPRSTRSPGKPFNISSPQQLGRVLFEDLNLPAPVKYGKGKTISTAADVLEELARRPRDCPQGARIPPAHQAEGHLRGRAARADRSRAPAACTPASTRPARPPDGSRRPIPTCRTSPSARSWAARSARPSCRAKAGSCWWRITRRSSCACWRTCRRTTAAGGSLPQRRGHPHAHRVGSAGRAAAAW